MRVDVCPNDDYDTAAALVAALAAVGARYEAAESFDSDGCSLGVGLHRFRTAAGESLTVYVDAWGVDLEGPDALANRVLAAMTGAD